MKNMGARDSRSTDRCNTTPPPVHDRCIVENLDVSDAGHSLRSFLKLMRDARLENMAGTLPHDSISARAFPLTVCYGEEDQACRDNEGRTRRSQKGSNLTARTTRETARAYNPTQRSTGFRGAAWGLQADTQPSPSFLHSHPSLERSPSKQKREADQYRFPFFIGI